MFGGPCWIRTNCLPIMSRLPIPLMLKAHGASNRNRTSTPFRARDFKSLVSTYFTILAKCIQLITLYSVCKGELLGAQGETRTRKTLFLRQVSIPIPSPGHNLVLPRGIEPRSTVLQTAAMTTSAKVAWYTVTGSNRRPSPCKGVALPLS